MVVMSIECREPSCAQSTLYNVHSATSTQHQGPESKIKSLGQKFQLILFTVKLSLNEFHWMVQPPRRNRCIMYYCDQEARFLDSNLTGFVHRVYHILRYHKSIVDYTFKMARISVNELATREKIFVYSMEENKFKNPDTFWLQ